MNKWLRFSMLTLYTQPLATSDDASITRFVAIYGQSASTVADGLQECDQLGARFIVK